MKVKMFILLTFFAFFVNCEVPFEDNSRLLIKGQVLDENNLPITDADVAVYVGSNNNAFLGSDGQLIGEGKTISDGTFSIVTLFGRDDNFIVEVFVNNEYSTYSYKTNTVTFTPTNLLIDLGTVPIKRRALFNLNITRTSPPDTEFQYTIAYKSNMCNEVYMNEELIEEESFCFNTETFGGNLSNDNPTVDTNFSSIVGSDVVFTYSVNRAPQITQTLTIDQTDYGFNFSY